MTFHIVVLLPVSDREVEIEGVMGFTVNHGSTNEVLIATDDGMERFEEEGACVKAAANPRDLATEFDGVRVSE
jgi:hypothetical protein